MTRKLNKETLNSIKDLGKEFSDVTIRMHEAIAKKAGLSGTDHKYLSILIQNGPMTAGQLAKLTGLTTGAVTGLIDRLEKRKLVKRSFDELDRRKIMIIPNMENVEKILGGVFGDLQQRMIRIISKLTAKETEIIEKYLLSTITTMKEITNTLQKPNNRSKSKTK